MKFLQVVFFLLAANIAAAKSIDFLPVSTNPTILVNTNIVHKYYILSYNEANEQANWVYYTLTDSMVLNSGEERSNNFKVDTKVFTKSAKSTDYTNSGYDRGHLCPAGDMGFDPVAMKESFLMSNISPQAPEFNRGIWKELETQVRNWAKVEHRLYVVTGPVFKNNKGSIGKEKVLVPGYFFKIIYDPTDEPKLIAFVFPNEKSDRPLTDYVLSVDEAEKLTGFDFFSQLPDDQENKLESRVQLAGWFAGYAQEAPIAVQTKTKTVNNELYFYLILVLVILLVAVFVYLKTRRRR